MPWLDNETQAKTPQRLPVVLTVSEVKSLLNRLDGTLWLIASLLYADGCRLRTKGYAKPLRGGCSFDGPKSKYNLTPSREGLFHDELRSYLKMDALSGANFKLNYQSHLKHLKLKCLQPKTIEAYSRAIRRIGEFFDHQIDSLSEQQLVDYFTDLVASHSWSSVKLDLYGLKFCYAHVLRKPWVAPGLIKPPKTQRLPDIVTIAQAQRIFAATRVLSYRVFFFTLYSLGLRLGEGLRLQVGDIDAARWRVLIRDAKGNRDRFVPLPQATHTLLQSFWQVHRNPVLLFPNRHGGLKGTATATTPLDRGGVQTTMHKVVEACVLKKRARHTACATAMRPT
ncbi:phage integrase N-terminal SAM-like domain-containing protein [Candidatus Nitrotoga sp. 1052]|uniref:phage integrase N-terminal SAM-like domain-containing protein n=1 Tax=Candidatus Nitrotoga sp. 1052 TaxID=2886964 RepID=UPI002A4E18DA|nr:phage integrase N-terminal SAM-like domain-containing protein [Candidatus Nitrotoga sp. 1052]